jgi:hypothetical protein
MLLMRDIFAQMANTPMAAGAKFLHLKYLEVYLDGDLSTGYDYLSLVSFLDASPVLETFMFAVSRFSSCKKLCCMIVSVLSGYLSGLIFAVTQVEQDEKISDSVFKDDSNMRQMPQHKHDSLKNVTILGFCSAKSMVELACLILENTSSLECLTLDSVFDQNDENHIGRCSANPTRKIGECSHLTNEMILEANNGLMAIERYIVGKVPSTVKLDIRGPCCRCHTLEIDDELDF